MIPRIAVSATAISLLVTIACWSGQPAASPAATERAAFEKDEAKSTLSGRTTVPGTGTPEPPPPPPLLSFDFIDAENGWLAFGNTVSTSIMGTSDAGHSWVDLSQTPSEVRSLDFISGSEGWTQSGGGLYSTTDGGRTWQVINSSDLPENARIQFVDSAHGWAVASFRDAPTPRALGDSGLFASSDGGVAWTNVETPCGQSFTLGATFLDAASGWLACGGQPATAMEPKELYYTADAGQHWAPVSCACFDAGMHGVPNTMPWSGYLTDTFFLDETYGWMDATRGGLSATDDGGLTWNWVPTGVDCGDEFTTDAQLLSAEIGYVIASKCGGLTNLLGTTDGGVTWSLLYPSPFLENCSTPQLRSKQTHDLCGDSPLQ